MADDLVVQRLLRRMSSGDSSARGEIVKRYYKDVLRFCAYRSGRVSDAEDLAQETFLRLFKYFDSYTEKQQFKAYLFRIASNVCSTYLTNRYDADEYDESDFYEDAVSDDPETAAAVREAVAELPDAQREAVILFYFNGLHIKEISKVQNVPSSTVRTRLLRGREKLKEILIKEGFR